MPVQDCNTRQSGITPMPGLFMSFTIAIDGPAAAGKGTISRALAKHFGFAHLDTGLLYRAVASKVLEGQDPHCAARELTPADLERDTLRTAEVGAAASKVAVLPEVRAALIAFQRSFALQTGGAVLDGRDIGTVICPDAQAKLYVTAAPQVRAKRRLSELLATGAKTDFETVLSDVLARDDRDMNRAQAPLVAASDAVTLDTSQLTIEAAIQAAIDMVEQQRDAI
jgi:cytidylate kinase